MAPTAGVAGGHVERMLERYRGLALGALLDDVPDGGPRYLYDLVSEYPRRWGKGLRAALCLATCRAFGGGDAVGLNAAVTVELFHNAFLIHDDIQDESEQRRGGRTLHAEYGVGVALNVGNMTNLLALRRLAANRAALGSGIAWRLFTETELMMRHSLEGQAIEIGWIRDNVCDLDADDYYRMCLKKTSWYTCIYPCRTGVLVATGWENAVDVLDRYGWYLGAAFQIQDDALNLVGDYARYGKEIAGDLWEGKRTLILIDFMRRCTPEERERLVRLLSRTRAQRTDAEVRWLHGRLLAYDCVESARRSARDLALAARREGERALGAAADTEDGRFLLELTDYVVERAR
ncbi:MULTISPECIES: polyprenyl synthetase family protein [unclassified Micromonospora]|uniref:polyprenyl synthetase family protein n=1 Tax=unclassified Micromonospora TaxID=2617518 RepID=UPI001B39A9C6|nr:MULTISPECIES: polyprenyl synthetase family protein [unclassified Micromonospora]MBQ1041114.1 polyprenyl synthetase family protein [Micromonospora sp. C72]MBQ1055085.1 polyprenyl synthetase family protein [Micromonospora sp. C32]